ncbi:SH3 domain-binding protein 5-like [Portunus trituberculatus]|uniref:SH3 domain-binding protein 5-like n=1 Tax=Portunus trituberculatus TaxID=210409 RepID=UPI001E1CD8EB|nr:SH3 domain-binding protein 5-like [Portunus trituberculatus]
MAAAVPEEQLDPRIQVELEKLNTATDDINKLESMLEETNNAFNSTFTESTARLKSMGKKLGSCIEKARPFYEAQELARTSQLECQRAAVQYQRANALHQAAKETIALAEERFVNSRHENWQFDSAWQEMLNHATMKVCCHCKSGSICLSDHTLRISCTKTKHMIRGLDPDTGLAEQRVQQLQRGLKSSINKSLVYFEEKSRVEAQLESQKERAQHKRHLPFLQISEQIHEQRRCQMPREPGVGAELNSPPAGEDHQYNSNKIFTQQGDLTQEEKYWESLREKLEKLEVEKSDDKYQTIATEQEGRERSITGSSETPSCNGERFVSGQSSSQESKSDGESSSDGMVDSLDDAEPKTNLLSTCTTLLDEENSQDKLSKGRRTPIGTCEEVIGNELKRISAVEDHHSFPVSIINEMSVQIIVNNTTQPESDTTQVSDTNELNMSQKCAEMVTNEMRITELDVGVNEANLCDGDAKEEGDGSSFPSPTACQPSRGLSVIVEELEHCAMPE